MTNSAFRRVLLAATAMSALAATAHAQSAPTTPAPPAAAPADSTAVGEIVVTAQRRSESLQKVPIAITVLSGDQLAARQTTSAETLVEQVPSLSFRKGTTNVNSALNVRGVGTIAFASGTEPAVSTVLDGVVLARPGQATFDFLDLERIEVLRGPQGTLFGKNASAGLLNIITRRPSNTLSGFVEGSAFEGDEYRLRGQISGPLTDTLRASLSGLYSTYDGNAKNVFNGKTVNGYEHLGGRAKLEWTPTRDLTLTVIGDYLHGVDDASADVIGKLTNTAYNNLIFTPSLAPVVIGKHNFNIDNDTAPKTADINWGVSTQADYKLPGGYTLTSITAYRRWSNAENRDGDFRSDAPAFVFSGTGAASGDTGSRDVGKLQFRQFTQELRLASPVTEHYDFQVGGFYYRTSQDNFFNRTSLRCTASTLAANSLGLVPCARGSSTYTISARGEAGWNTKLENYAAFGQGSWRFTDALRVVGGVRYSHDTVGLNFTRTASPAGGGVNPSFTGTSATSAEGWTGRASFEYDVIPSVTTYVTYARGYKGPAINVFFNMQAFDRIPLSPETSNDYEGGVKATLFGRKLVLNTALFDEEFDGFQTTFIDLVAGVQVSRLINAGAVSTKGAEFEFVARPLPRLSLNGGLTYLWAQIDRFNCPAGTTVACAAAINGKTLPYAPKYKLAFAADYRVIASRLPVDIGLNTGYSWQSTTQYDINQSPDGIQPAYGIWDASIAAIDKADRWKLTFVARNLTDQYYTASRVTGAQLRLQVPRDADRYFGVVLRANFGG